MSSSHSSVDDVDSRERLREEGDNMPGRQWWKIHPAFARGRIRSAWLVCVLSIPALLPLPAAAVDVLVDVVPLDDLLGAMQSGGYVVVMRHAATDHSKKDIDRSQSPDCSKQRDLSEQGIREARAIGQAMQRLEIPIGAVYSSPYCRATNTARHAFGDFEVDPDLQFSISKSRADAAALARHLQDQLLSAEPGKRNIVFVTHTSNIRDATGIWAKPEGAALVFLQDGNSLRFRGLIKPEDW